MKAHIAAHNGKILSKKEEISEGCNCWENGDPCHHQGEQPNKQNWGTFKKQYRGHKFDFKHKDKYGTTLSRHIWRLRDMKVNTGSNNQFPSSKLSNFWTIRTSFTIPVW